MDLMIGLCFQLFIICQIQESSITIYQLSTQVIQKSVRYGKLLCSPSQWKKDSLYISVYVKMSSSLWPLPYIFPFDGDKLYIG